MSSRYLCLHCWRILPEAETRLQPENLAPPAPAAVLPAAPAPVPAPVVAAAAPAAVPATRHWLQDPNAAAVSAPAAVPAAPAVPVVPPVPSPAPAPRKPLLGFLDSVLGESDDDDEIGGRKARPQERGHRFCVCGATLGSHSRLEGQPSLLGFAGARSAGKTILLLSTLHQLDRAEAHDGREISLLGVGDTEERFRALRHEFFVHRQKPGATVPDAPIPTGQAINSYCWTLRTSDVPVATTAGSPRPDAARREPKNGSARAQLFGIFDVAGESWRDLKRDGNSRLLRYLDLLGLLFFVVDGAALADDLGLDSRDAWNAGGPRGDSGAADMQIFSALCERLGPRTRDISLAIVISKADLLWDAEPWRGLGPESPIDGAERQNLVARLLKESCRGSLFPEARQLFRRVGLFAVSGLGFRPEAGDVSDDHKLARQPHPHNVLEPLHFLLEDHLPRRKN